MSAPVVRPARASDRDALYAICRATGNAGEDASAAGRDPDLLGHLYAGPYLALAPQWAWVAEDSLGVCAYALAVPDTASFYAAMAQSWLPPLRARYGDQAHPDDAALLAQLHAKPQCDPRLGEWPAHLHVDLLPRAQGQGLGGVLMRTLLDALGAAGVRGVHLGVDPRNERALAWYPRFGFTPMWRDQGCVWMVRSLEA
ncbi:GNAT family N-acetyltransferase [Chitinimonas sp.]|uniref:GNAT family N-acetyltransferase n=1 Tax=Chitinimonas sp. TaxID=1934313 RepID=UPI0035AE854B